MRQLRYSVAMSLDGFIAGPKGDYDWIVIDPNFDWKAFFSRFDTMLMGRRSYQVMLERGQSPQFMGLKAVVVSTTLDPARHPGVTILGRNVPESVAGLKAAPGKDVWLSGGGVLFRSLLDAGLVDSVEVAVVPVLLGSGVPLLPEGRRESLKLIESKPLPSGIVMLSYAVTTA